MISLPEFIMGAALMTVILIVVGLVVILRRYT